MTSNTKWRKKNPEKVRCYWMVHEAIRSGHIESKPCVKCGELKTHAHHEDYTKPFEIIWLCSFCHRQLHAEQQGQTIWPKGTNDRDRYEWTREHKPCIPRKKELLLSAAQELRDQGQSYREIGLALKVSKGTVFKWLNDTVYK